MVIFNVLNRLTLRNKRLMLFLIKRKDSYEEHDVCSNGVVNAWIINQFCCLNMWGTNVLILGAVCRLNMDNQF
jgi:hypothetical protein